MKVIQRLAIEAPVAQRARCLRQDFVSALAGTLGMKAKTGNLSHVVNPRLLRRASKQSLVKDQCKPQQKIPVVVDAIRSHFEWLEFETQVFLWMNGNSRRDGAAVIGAHRLSNGTADAPK